MANRRVAKQVRQVANPLAPIIGFIVGAVLAWLEYRHDGQFSLMATLALGSVGFIPYLIIRRFKISSETMIYLLLIMLAVPSLVVWLEWIGRIDPNILPPGA